MRPSLLYCSGHYAFLPTTPAPLGRDRRRNNGRGVGDGPAGTDRARRARVNEDVRRPREGEERTAWELRGERRAFITLRDRWTLGGTVRTARVAGGWAEGVGEDDNIRGETCERSRVGLRECDGRFVNDNGPRVKSVESADGDGLAHATAEDGAGGG